MEKRLKYQIPSNTLLLGVLAYSLPFNVNPSLEKTLETNAADGVVVSIQEADPMLKLQKEEVQPANDPFLGLTEDGQYLVSAVLPISSSLFYAVTDSLSEADW